MVWGHAGGQPADDPFGLAEREIRAMVASPWWAGAPPGARVGALSARVLAMPDGSSWLFGSGGRWYRRNPADGAWHLCPPPMAPVARGLGRPMAPLPGGRPAVPVPLEIVPAPPDLARDRGSFQGFVGPDCPRTITDSVDTLLTDVMRRSEQDYPTTWPVFTPEYPSTVAAVWGSIMWCAYAPVFDGNEPLLSLFGECLATPLPGDEWVRWLPPLPLATLIGLYGERLRAGRVDVAMDLVHTMISTAEILRADPRFRPRADALIAMAGPARANPQIDYVPLAQGDHALLQGWLRRCPPTLRPATAHEAAPGQYLRHAVYDLAETLPLGHTNATGIVEPRMIAVALLAADLCAVRPDLVGRVAGWLEPEMRHVLRLVAGHPGHQLRAFWPQGDTLPGHLTPPGEEAAAAFLGAAYAVDVAWCRLTGTSVPARGFPVPAAVARHLIDQQWASTEGALD